MAHNTLNLGAEAIVNDGEPRNQAESVQSEEAAPETETAIETETPAPPAEKPVEEPVAPDVVTPDPLQEVKTQIKALQEERTQILKDISELRGTKREIKQDQLRKVDDNIQELKDVHPDDVAVIDRVAKQKGFVTKEEANRMFYDAVKQDELTKFLDKYPEYKPENDPGDANWSNLQKELGLYRMPENPRDLTYILERAHRALPKVKSERVAEAKHRVQVAGVGAGGVQRSSPSKTTDPRLSSLMDSHMQGWSDEEIKNLKNKLPE